MKPTSLRRRLTVTSALSSSFALLLACGCFLGYEIFTFRKSLVSDLTTDAQVLAFGLTAPLLFDDPQAATAALKALAATPRVRSAVLTRNAKVFATFGQPGPALAPSSSEAWYRFESDRLLLGVPVVSDGAVIGALMLEASLDEHDRRIRQYLLLTGLVLAAAWMAALAIAARLRRGILQPILQLTEGARKVSRDADYSVRVSTQADEELAVLATTFNFMLGKIEEQSAGLRKSEARFARLLDAGIIGIAVADGAGTVVEANDAYLKIVGYSREDLVTGKIRSENLTPPQWRPATEETQRRLAAAGMAEAFEKEYLRKDGHLVPVLIGSAMLDETSSIGVVLDISERKRLERVSRDAFELEEQNRRIQEANRLKSEFLANMSHELRTPLNSILGFGELLLYKKAPPELHDEFLGDIVKSGRHLLQLINDVLDLAKVEAGKLEFRPEPIDLQVIVDEVLSIVRAIALTKNIPIKAEVDARLRKGLILDPARLKQILYNFISNALKFTPAGGAVTVRAKEESETQVLIEVEDTGPGIAPQDIPRLFVEFQQLDAGAAKQHGGTGLGLALTKRLAEAQAGSVGVRSTPGKGSVFFVILPKQSLVVEAPAKPRRPARTAGTDDRADAVALDAEQPGGVLVLDDDEGSLKLMAAALAQLGSRAIAMQDGEEALRAAARSPPDAVVLDLFMPGMDGFEFLDRLRRLPGTRQTPVLIWTVKELSADDRARLSRSAQAIVRKGQGGGQALLDDLRRFLSARRR